jgi:hypothetical protein
LDGVQREGGVGHPFRMRARGGIPGRRRDKSVPWPAQGVDLSDEQQTKTALEYFSQNLTAAATS